MTPDFLKNLPIPARMLFRPMLMISLVLHGVVLMLPIASDLRVEQPKMSKQYKQVKIAQLPTTRSSPNSSPESSAKANPQPSPQLSQPTPAKLPTRPESSLELNPQPSPQLRQSIRLDPPTRPKAITIRPQLDESPIRERKSRSQPQSKKEEEQQQPTEQAKRSPSTEEPKPSPSTEQPTPSPSPQQPTPSPSPQQPTPSPSPPTPSPSPQQPTPSPSTEEAKGNNEGTGGGYGQYNLSLPILAAIEEIKPRLGEDRLKLFKAERDINKLAESNQFKSNEKPDTTRFIFLQKALSPLTTQEITSALQTQLNTKDFHCDPNPKGSYGGGPVYEVTKGDVKFYLIFAPGMDDNGAMTAIIFSQKFPT